MVSSFWDLMVRFWDVRTPHEPARSPSPHKRVAKPMRTVAVRGNVFSFLLPWDRVMQKLSSAWASGDFTEWPLDQDTVCEILTVRFVRGQEALMDQFKQLKVRSRVVKRLANIYIDNHYAELVKKGKVMKLLSAR